MARNEQPFDVEAATQAWLANSTTYCARHDCSMDYSGLLAFATPLAIVAALLLFTVTGLASRVEKSIGSMIHRRWLQAMVFVIPVSIVIGAVTLPVRYWLSRAADLHSGGVIVVAGIRMGDRRSFFEFANQHFWMVAGWMLLAMLLAPMMIWATRRIPNWIWLVPAIAASGMIVEQVQRSQPYETIHPLPGGLLRDQISRIGSEAGFDPAPIVMGKWQVLSGTAFLQASAERIDGTPHVVLGDGLFNILPGKSVTIKPTPTLVSAAEVRAVFGHEIAHIKLGHLWARPLLLSALAILLAAMAWFAGLALTRRFASAWRLEDQTSLAALPVPAGLLWLAWTLLPLPAHAIIQLQEQRADEAGLDYSRDPDGMAAFSAREALQGPATRPVVAQWLLYDHPMPATRVRTAMRWKAAHPDASDWPPTPTSPFVRAFDYYGKKTDNF